MMKVKALQTGYYDDAIINPGEIFNYKGKKLPTWATLADGIETKKEKQPKKEETSTTDKLCDAALNKNKDAKADADVDVENKGTKETPEADADKETTEENNTATEVKTDEATVEEKDYLELLINEGIEKEVFIEDADKKTVKEQIVELEAALNKKGN